MVLLSRFFWFKKDISFNLLFKWLLMEQLHIVINYLLGKMCVCGMVFDVDKNSD